MTIAVGDATSVDMSAIEVTRLQSSKEDKKCTEENLDAAIDLHEKAASRRFDKQIESLEKDLGAEEMQDLFGHAVGVGLGAPVVIGSAALGFFVGGPLGFIAGLISGAIAGAIMALAGEGIGRGFGELAGKGEHEEAREADHVADVASLDLDAAQSRKDDANDFISKQEDKQKAMLAFMSDVREHARKMREKLS